MKNSIKRIIGLCMSIIMIASCYFPGYAANNTDSKEVLTYASSKIYVNEEAVDVKGFLIEDNNYFKLRDIAQSLNDTEKCFQVEYDSENCKVVISIGEKYSDEEDQTYVIPQEIKDKAIKTKSKISIDGENVEIDAYNVNGNNYVKLRDVAKLIDFALMYYHETKSVKFDTEKTYSESQDFYPEGYNEEGGNDIEPKTDEVERQPSVEPDEYNKEVKDSSGLYSTELINEYSKYFINHVDGYKIMVSKSMKADMSISEFRTVLSNDELQIEIYDQALENSSAFSSYVNYGNKFISDTSLYKKISSYYATFAGHKAYILEWSRSPLAGVSNDKCYYASVDVKMSSTRALTFLFKSSKPFDVSGGGKTYANIMNTLSIVSKTASAVNKQKSTVLNTNWDLETRNLYNTYFIEKSNVTWGIFEPFAPFLFTRLDEIETKLNHNFKFLIYYVNINTDVTKLEQVLNNASDKGRTVELTLQTVANSNGKGNMLMDVLDGKYDTFLDNFARSVAKSGKPVLFRLCNEMNGDWCMYSAYHTSKDTEIFKEFYRYVYKKFEKNGALKNTIWVWNPNWKSYPDYDWNHALCYYPGDEYVDVVGLTAYNTGTYYSGEKWSSFDSLYDKFYYQYCAWFSQPLMITEFSCSSYGGDKSAWVKNMLNKISTYSRIKVAIWWSFCDYDSKGNVARSYYIDDNLGVIESFRNYFAVNKE